MKTDQLITSEYYECLALVHYMELMQKMGKILLFTHIPNSTFTKSWLVKRKNKLMGVRPGFPDYVVISPKTILFIEMKRTKGGVVSPDQKIWIQALKNLGLPTAVCKGFEEAKLFLEVNG